jgi:uncharacterized protein
MEKDNHSIGRRQFLKVGGAAAVAASATRILGAPGEANAATPVATVPPDFIIDSHIHWGRGDQWIDDMVRIYRQHNAMACVLTWMEDLDELNQAVTAYPDVFIPYGRVNVDNENAIREVQAFYDSGCVGMKFHSPQKNWDDISYFQIYRLCEQLGLVMLFHTGVSSRRNIDATPRWGSPARMRPMYLDTLCRLFPQAIIQGAHLGNPWYEEAAEAARWSPNLFFDVTGSTLYKLIELNQLERLSEILWWARWSGEAGNPHTLQGGPTAWEHIVFGTDEGPDGLPGNIERFQMMMDANRVDVADRPKMWGLTIANILGIDPATKRLVRL